jgi:hypothetical protein
MAAQAVALQQLSLRDKELSRQLSDYLSNVS